MSVDPFELLLRAAVVRTPAGDFAAAAWAAAEQAAADAAVVARATLGAPVSAVAERSSTGRGLEDVSGASLVLEFVAEGGRAAFLSVDFAAARAAVDLLRARSGDGPVPGALTAAERGFLDYVVAATLDGVATRRAARNEGADVAFRGVVDPADAARRIAAAGLRPIAFELSLGLRAGRAVWWSSAGAAPSPATERFAELPADPFALPGAASAVLRWTLPFRFAPEEAAALEENDFVELPLAGEDGSAAPVLGEIVTETGYLLAAARAWRASPLELHAALSGPPELRPFVAPGGAAARGTAWLVAGTHVLDSEGFRALAADRVLRFALDRDAPAWILAPGLAPLPVDFAHVEGASGVRVLAAAVPLG
jgi:hypothetical protein